MNEIESILAVDIGSTTTRALLFDVVENTYRLVGYAEAPTTVEAPYRDASEGMRHALISLQAIAGRTLLDASAHLIMPATGDGRGVDVFVPTASAGPPVRTLLVGLLPDVSLRSARRVVSGTYLQVVDAFSLGDRRGEDQQIDAVLAARPDVIVIAGGTDAGASGALLKLVENVGLAVHLLSTDVRPRALYAGNAELEPRIQELLGRVAAVQPAANVQPDLGDERLEPARAELVRLYETLRLEQVGGYGALAQAAGSAASGSAAGRIIPTAQAAGFWARFLSRLPAWPRGVLLVDVGSANTFIAAAWSGRLYLGVQAGLGIGLGAGRLAPDGDVHLLDRWLPFEVTPEALREFLGNKETHPNTIPVERNDLCLEHALARVAIRRALAAARPEWPDDAPGPRADLLPWFSLIMGSGAALGQAPRPGLAALLLLDGVQPSGVTRLVLDPYHLSAALGAMARANAVAAAQVYDSPAFIELGTAVSLIGPVRADTAACHVELAVEGGTTTEAEVKGGTITVLPLAPGQTGKLTLRPRPTINAGFGLGRGRTLTLTGGAVGIVIDARGRPLAWPRAADQRRALVDTWYTAMEGK